MEFLEGIVGTGKTTYATQKLATWLSKGVPPQEILILVPDRSIGRSYQKILSSIDVPNSIDTQVVTFGGLAQRSITLFWSELAPLVIQDWDGRQPTYLTVETAQYYLSRFVDPVREAGRFDAVSLPRARLIAQILNNYSASVINGFSLEEALRRLSSSWTGHSSRVAVYEAAIEVVTQYREHCLNNARLDFSLQIELYTQVLIKEKSYKEYAQKQYKYLIVDNIEESFPVAIDFIQDWLWSHLTEALIIHDRQGGYRVFLGASGAVKHYDITPIASGCERFIAEASYIQSEKMKNLTHAVSTGLSKSTFVPYDENPLSAFDLSFSRFYPQMVDWVAHETIQLVSDGVEPRDIAILAPFLGDSLRFSLYKQLEDAGIPHISNRPSRALRDEPITRALLTALKIVYGTERMPTPTAIQQMFVQLIGMDVIRADLLSQVVYRNGTLSLFENVGNTMQQRITYQLGERYEVLRQYIYALQELSAEIPQDHVIQKLFEFCSQQDYGLYQDIEAARVVNQLVNSAYHFRSVIVDDTHDAVARGYIDLVEDGVLAAYQYMPHWLEEQNAVYVVPAYTFLMRNRVSKYQFWVDAGSTQWFERLEQPITHPYVLRRDYPSGQPWTDTSEFEAQQHILQKLILGLMRRCSDKIYLGFSDLSEQGFEQRGELLKVFNQILQVYGE